MRSKVGSGGKRSRPSAALVLGVLSGVIAALAMLPAAVPLLYRLFTAEVQAEHAQIYARTAKIGLALERDEPLPESVGRAKVVRAMTQGGDVLLERADIEVEPYVEDHVCGEPSGVAVVRIRGQEFSASCFENATLRVFAVWSIPSKSYIAVGTFVLALAAVAGLVTALGVLQLLRPLSQISKALDRVGTGQKGVRMAPTGLAELDDLIHRLNAAANAVEEREYNIMARVHVVQEMARLVAHEIRNPLQSLELLTTLVAQEDDPAERKLLTANIHAEIRALDDVVTRLLREGATRGALRIQLRDFDLQLLLDHVLAVRGAEARQKGARIVVENQHSGPVPVDRVLFTRAIENLVANALRAVPNGDGLVRLRVEADESEILLRVDDNGPGVDPELGESVFEANVTGGLGTGLGLSLTRGVVEAHGGSVTLSRSDLGGARFDVRVPRYAHVAEAQ